MKYYVVDAFTENLFGGNPAGVCPLSSWLPDELLQNIAMENNLSETAFFVKEDGHYRLRWFTPELEVDLCGHATIASAYVLFNLIEPDADQITFNSLSGKLTVTKGEDGLMWLDFPARAGVPASNYLSLEKGLGLKDFEVFKSSDIMVVVKDEKTVRELSLDFEALKSVKFDAEMPSDDFGIIVTAPGEECDFVSRFFGPNVGINEDPVTGRAHCVLTPYWSKRLRKQALTARQISKRGGRLWCEASGDRVKIGGKGVLYLRGEILL